MVLTGKDKEELHEAILEYLSLNNFKEAAKHFQAEAGVTPAKGLVEKSKIKDNILEKKWKSIVKLRKQVMDKEVEIKQLRENTVCERCENGPDVGGFSKGKQVGDGLPREPAKYTLSGHRAKVVKVIVHPFYSLAASASEDASIRLWDFEQGEHERTLKGHSGMVTNIVFSPNG